MIHSEHSPSHFHSQKFLIPRPIIPAGASKLSQGLSTIVTFNYSFSACHHESASPGNIRSLQSSSDWLIWPGQESKFRSLKWDTKHIWQGLRVWCSRTCSFWCFPVLQLQEKVLCTCVHASVSVCCTECSWVPQRSCETRVTCWCGGKQLLNTKLYCMYIHWFNRISVGVERHIIVVRPGLKAGVWTVTAGFYHEKNSYLLLR